jgi:hypothetical protein
MLVGKTTTGQFGKFLFSTPVGAMWGSTRGPYGALWFAEVDTDRMGRVSLGTSTTFRRSR